MIDHKGAGGEVDQTETSYPSWTRSPLLLSSNLHAIRGSTPGMCKICGLPGIPPATVIPATRGRTFTSVRVERAVTGATVSPEATLMEEAEDNSNPMVA